MGECVFLTKLKAALRTFVDGSAAGLLAGKTEAKLRGGGSAVGAEADGES